MTPPLPPDPPPRHGWHRLPPPLRGGVAWLGRVWHAFHADQCLLWAAAMAFSTLFALLPLTVLAFSLFKAFYATASYQDTLLEALVANFIPALQPPAREYLNAFFLKGYEADLAGVGLFVVAAFLWLNSIEESLNHVWKIHRVKTMWERLPVYWTTITLAPLLIGLSLFFSRRVGLFLGGAAGEPVRGLELVLPMAVSWMLFFLFYKILPSRSPPTRQAALGALMAAVLWEGAKGLFSYYVTHIANYERFYGVFGAVFSFLLWTYVTWIILLLAAEVAINWPWRGERDGDGAPDPESE